MTHSIELHAYLAGPDVFFPDAAARGESKKAKLAAVGIEGHFPGDNEPREAKDCGASLIAMTNEGLMLECCQTGRIGIILLDMTPYRGPFMDVGTAFEAGFMSMLAEARNNIIIIGYTEDERTLEERVIQQIFGGKCQKKNGRVFGPDGHKIEAYGKADSLMVMHAIEKTGGSVVNGFDAAVALAKKLAEAKKQNQSTAGDILSKL